MPLIRNLAQRNKEDGSSKKPTRSYSKKQEDQVAKKFNGNRTLNSGATPFQKGDVTLEKFLIECKTKMTPSESISIKKEWIEKNKEESFSLRLSNQTICFNFGPQQPNYYVINEKLMKFLVEKLEEEEM